MSDPAFMRRLNGWLTMFWITMFWIAMIPVSAADARAAPTYVSALSIWALVSGHWST
jgi:hypothetical protein